MTLHSTARVHVMLASVIGFALAAAAAYAQSQPAGASATDKTLKPAHTSQPKPVGMHAKKQALEKVDEHEVDMILLQEPFRPSQGTAVDYKGSR